MNPAMKTESPFARASRRDPGTGRFPPLKDAPMPVPVRVRYLSKCSTCRSTLTCGVAYG